jgi:hypothetical protein
MRHYERRLPHWEAVGEPLFVTFRLHGSLPANRVFPPERLTTSGEAFRAMDRILDRGGNGPLFLQRPAIARLVVDALRDGDSRFHRYQLRALVVMPNQVTRSLLPRLCRRNGWDGKKGFMAHRANQLLGAHGRAFWQDESYDHLIRSEAEFARIRAYVEQNPVTAGLAATAEQFEWSSAKAA